MSLQLFAHPFSSYCQKVFIALYENDIPFQLRTLGPDDPQTEAEFTALWPIRKMPLLLDRGQAIREATIIIEHLAVHYPGPVQLIPSDPLAAVDVRFMDRFFDNYVMTPQQKFVFDRLRPAEHRDPYGVDEARRMLETAYRWLDQRMKDRQWACGDTFTLADCAAAPSLFYADWTHPIAGEFADLRRYRQRLLARPSFARAGDGGRPYRAWFPLGAPDRD